MCTFEVNPAVDLLDHQSGEILGLSKLCNLGVIKVVFSCSYQGCVILRSSKLCLGEAKPCTLGLFKAMSFWATQSCVL